MKYVLLHQRQGSCLVYDLKGPIRNVGEAVAQAVERMTDVLESEGRLRTGDIRDFSLARCENLNPLPETFACLMIQARLRRHET